MAATVQINNISTFGQSILVAGFIVLSGTYPTGGDPLNFATAVADPSFIGLIPSIESSALLNVDAWSMGGAQIGASNVVAYVTACTKTGTPAMINPATGCKLKVAALGATTEHTASSYESQYTGDTIAFQATFTKMV